MVAGYLASARHRASVNMPDTLHWSAVGSEGLIRATADNGATWTDRASGTDENLDNVFFANLNDGWAIGDRGAILHTSDGGKAWTPQTRGPDRQLNGI